MRMVSQFFSKLEVQADNWRKFQDYISHYFFEKDDINRLVVSAGVVKSNQVGCGDQMFFRLHAVLPSRERPRNFVFRVNRETARFDPTTRPFTYTQSRVICIHIYIWSSLVYIRKIHGSKIASRPEKDIVRARLSTSIKEFPSSELKDKAVVIAAGI